MRPWQDFIVKKYQIGPVELHEIKGSLKHLAASVRELYQRSKFCPLEFLDFLYGTTEVTYDEGEEEDGDVEEDTGIDEVCLRYFGQKKAVKKFATYRTSQQIRFCKLFGRDPLMQDHGST